MRLLILVVLIVAGCASQPRNNPVKMEWTPTRAQWEAVRSAGTALKRPNGSDKMFLSPALIDSLLTVTSKLEGVSGMKVELAIVETDYPQALAKPHEGRRYVALSTSYLDRLGNDPDAIADTLGHEMAHLHLGHSGEARQRRDATAAGIGVAAGTAANLVIPFSGVFLSAATAALSQSFTRSEERDADSLGLGWAVAAGYDPCGRARVMGVLARLSASNITPMLSTHPSYAERSALADEYAKKATGRGC